MSESLADTLSEIDNPDAIRRILTTIEPGDVQPANLENSSDTPTLETLYERYLTRRMNRSPATIAQYKRTIPPFLEFVESRGVVQPEELHPELIELYIDGLHDQYDSDATILTYTKNVRAWLKWQSKRQLCDEAVFRVLDKTELGLSPTARDEAIPATEANEILDNLRSKRRGTALHALMELAWNVGPRIGGVHSLDIKDFDAETRELRIRHRPEKGTRLKNGREYDGQPGDGERNVLLAEHVIRALKIYIGRERPDVTDDYDRKPLFATEYGRPSRSTLRRWIYDATSCRWRSTKDDGHTCDGNCNSDSDVCVYSYCPHAIRRGAIVHHLDNGLPHDYATERFDVSKKILDKHYDPRSKRRKKENRARAVKECWEVI